MAIDINTHYRGYEGVYGGGAFELRISYDGSGLNIASVYFNGDLEEVTEGEFLFAPRDFQFEFITSDDHVTASKYRFRAVLCYREYRIYDQRSICCRRYREYRSAAHQSSSVGEN